MLYYYVLALLRSEIGPNGDIQLPGTTEEGEAPCRSSGISDLCKEAGMCF